MYEWRLLDLDVSLKKVVDLTHINLVVYMELTEFAFGLQLVDVNMISKQNLINMLLRYH